MIFPYKKMRKGFTLLELSITVALTLIVVLSIGIYIVDMQRGWGRMWQRVNSDIVNDGIVSRKAFDSYIRRAMRSVLIAADGSSVRVHYWNDPANNTNPEPDRYVRFFQDGNTLKAEHGTTVHDGAGEGVIRTETLANNVQKCVFSVNGNSIQMSMRLYDEETEYDISVYSSAVMHNQI